MLLLLPTTELTASKRADVSIIWTEEPYCKVVIPSVFKLLLQLQCLFWAEWHLIPLIYLHTYPFFSFFAVNTDFRKPIDELKQACSRCFGFGIVWGVGRSSSQRSPTGHDCRDHSVGKVNMVTLGQPSGSCALCPNQHQERSLCLAPCRLLPEHKAVMEPLSLNQKASISVRYGVGYEHYALGEAKADSINICFFDCSSVWHIQVLLKSINKLFFFPYPSHSSDVRESFTGNLRRKKKE